MNYLSQMKVQLLDHPKIYYVLQSLFYDYLYNVLNLYVRNIMLPHKYVIASFKRIQNLIILFTVLQRYLHNKLFATLQIMHMNTKNKIIAALNRQYQEEFNNRITIYKH